ncbi:hypothetical protein Bca101_034666 [Brassica carinata]
MDRLGPLLDEATDTEKEQREEENLKQKKRKPGRPPGKNKVNASPLSLPGASSKLRKVRAKPAVCRRKIQTEPTTGRTAKATKGRKSSVIGGSPQDRADTNSDNLPICNLIPPSTRRRMDFRVHSNPAP